MLPIKPYMLQACYDWICDSGLTPQLLVDASLSGVQVPTEYVQDNLIILNISPTAVRELNLMGEPISFSARFGGHFRSIIVPIGAVRVIYARESRQGIALTSFDEGFVMPSEDNSPPKEEKEDNFMEKRERDARVKGKKPSLKLVD